MKKPFQMIIIAALLTSCIGESGTKITGTFAGKDAAKFSEVQVFVQGTPLLETPAVVTDSKFILNLPPVPSELTVPWLNRDGSEHVRIAEAEVVANGNKVVMYDIKKREGIYCYIYADRDADMKGWHNYVPSSFFNWVIADWWARSNVKVEWNGYLKKGWNTVWFTCERTTYSSEQRSGTAEVEFALLTTATFQSSDAIALQPPPTGKFNGKIVAKTNSETIYCGYSSNYDSVDDTWEGVWSSKRKFLYPFAATGGKCRFTLPDPPQDEMKSYTGLVRLFHENSIQPSTAMDFDVSARTKNVKLTDIGFWGYGNIYDKRVFMKLEPYSNNKKVYFVYSEGEIIIQGNKYSQSLSACDQFNLHFKKGWNTVVCTETDNMHSLYETAEINGEIEFQ